jgi:hypothetical protein
MQSYCCDLTLGICNMLSEANKSYEFIFHFLAAKPGSVQFPVLPDFLHSSGSGTGSTQPHEDK